MKALNNEQIDVCKIVDKYDVATIAEKFDLIHSYFKILNNKEICGFIDEMKTLAQQVVGLKDDDSEVGSETSDGSEIDVLYIDKYYECFSIDDALLTKLVDIFVKSEFKITRLDNMLKIIIDNISNFTINLFRNVFYIIVSHSIIKIENTDVLHPTILLDKLKRIEKKLVKMYKHQLYNHIQIDIQLLRKAIEENMEKFENKENNESKDENQKVKERVKQIVIEL